MGMEGNPASSPLSLSPESIIRKCKIYNGLWRGDDTWAEDTRARSKFASPSPKSIIRKCKIYNGFWRRDDIGGWRISSPRVLFPRAEKVSSGNVKFTMDFSWEMILGMEGNLASSPLSPSPESIIRKCKIYNGFWRGDDTWAENTIARGNSISPSPKSIIRKCKIYNRFWRGDGTWGIEGNLASSPLSPS